MRVSCTCIFALLQVLLLTQGVWGGGERQRETRREGGGNRAPFVCTPLGVRDALMSGVPSIVSCLSPTPVTLRRNYLFSNSSVDLDGNGFLILHGAGLYHVVIDDGTVFSLRNLNLTNMYNNNRGGGFVVRGNSKLNFHQVVIEKTHSNSDGNIIASHGANINIEYSTINSGSGSSSMMYLVNSSFTTIGSTFSGEEEFSLLSKGGQVSISYSTFYSPYNQSVAFTDSCQAYVEKSILKSVIVSSSTLLSGGYNIIEQAYYPANDSFGTTDLVGVETQLSDIGYHGGETPTFIPLSGSPAINFVAQHSSPGSRDQSGGTRERNGAPDCGSFETDKFSGVFISPQSYATLPHETVVNLQIHKPYYSGADITVTWQTQDISAKNGEDYVSSHGIVSWTYPNVEPYNISVPLIKNEFVRGDREFVVVLSSSSADLIFASSNVAISGIAGPVLSGCRNGIFSCSENADCIDVFPSFSCVCRPGFGGDGYDCSDINECEEGIEGRSACSNRANCINTEGSYNCSCKDGFQGDGINCIDVDECARDPRICSPETKCINNDGYFSCVPINEKTTDDGGVNKKGIFVGAIVGGVCCLCIAALGIYFWSVRRTNKPQPNYLAELEDYSSEMNNIQNNNHEEEDDDSDSSYEDNTNDNNISSNNKEQC